MSGRRGVAISGTHGKSTATAMAGDMLSSAGLDPTVIYGATPLEPRSGSRLGHSRWLLAEACEYRENFRYLKPQMAVVLGVDLDHVDCYAQLSDVEAAFARFVESYSGRRCRHRGRRVCRIALRHGQRHLCARDVRLFAQRHLASDEFARAPRFLLV